MKKVLVLISIVFLIILAGCSAENNEIMNNDILTETTEHTTLSAPVNQKGDLSEKQDIKEIRNIYGERIDYEPQFSTSFGLCSYKGINFEICKALGIDD